MKKLHKTVLALTTGDPAGIGPEISLRAAALPEVRELCQLVLIGDECVFRAVAKELHLSLDGIVMSDCKTLATPPPPGIASAAGGNASFLYIQEALRGATEGRYRGVVTAPINKYSLRLAGHDFPGHTEMFGEFTKSESYAMLMYSSRVAVGLVTCHQSLMSVGGSLTRERIVEVGRLLDAAMLRIRGKRPRIAVLGLNPHAGEEGLFGREDMEIVKPAVEDLRSAGIDAEGPLPPDTAFTPRALEHYDAYLCLYHDQGLIPFKALSFSDGVNVTMGLPFVRTSVDHGTAYDLAWKGLAEIDSMVEAIRLAARLAES